MLKASGAMKGIRTCRLRPARLGWLARSPAAAADTLLYAATAPAEEVGGQYCGTAPQVGHHSRAAGDPALAQRLWQLSAHLCQLSAEETLS